MHSDSAATSRQRTGDGPRSLSVVIPVLNEAGGLDALEQRLRTSLESVGRSWEVIFVDDGSRDRTLEVLRELHARDARFKTVAFSRNFGKEIAVAAGLRYATGDGVVIMDGDLQHPPELIADFIVKWDEGYDIVYAQRTDRATEGTIYKLAARGFYSVFHFLSGTELPDGAGDFRLLDRKAVDAINRIGERARFNKGLYAWVGFRSVGIPYEVAERKDGRSRFRPRQLLRFALDGIASFTTIPLRVWSYLGLIIAALALIYAMFELLKTLIYGVQVPGFAPLIISLMFFAGIQLISLGVIGEYLGRVYEEVKGRPLFIVAETIGAEEFSARPPAGEANRSGSR
jgi:glycosyltransferase involved in cell wall biosynthesis